MLKYFISILFFLHTCISYGQDTSVVDTLQPPPDVTVEAEMNKDSLHQLRFGIDIARVIINQLQDERSSYEFELDYYFKKEIYFVAEGGFGTADLNNSNVLSYKTNSAFARVGINKSLLPRERPGDWDMAFIGLRYGVGFINRGAASYTIADSVWGSVAGTVPAEQMTAHWAEITAGVRVEFIKSIFIGWNVRGKFLLNGNSFGDLPPYYIAGYGKGEKNTIFDFNVFLSYAIRW